MGKLMIFSPEVALSVAEKAVRHRQAARICAQQMMAASAAAHLKKAVYYERAIREYADRLMSGY